jgi:hypothetical protein
MIVKWRYPTRVNCGQYGVQYLQSNSAPVPNSIERPTRSSGSKFSPLLRCLAALRIEQACFQVIVEPCINSDRHRYGSHNNTPRSVSTARRAIHCVTRLKALTSQAPLLRRFCGALRGLREFADRGA